jgi:hypothetical protein
LRHTAGREPARQQRAGELPELPQEPCALSSERRKAHPPPPPPPRLSLSLSFSRAPALRSWLALRPSTMTTDVTNFFSLVSVRARSQGTTKQAKSFGCVGRAEGVLAHHRAPCPTKAIRSSSSTCSKNVRAVSCHCERNVNMPPKGGKAKAKADAAVEDEPAAKKAATKPPKWGPNTTPGALPCPTNPPPCAQRPAHLWAQPRRLRPSAAALRPRRGPQCIARGWLPARAGCWLPPPRAAAACTLRGGAAASHAAAPAFDSSTHPHEPLPSPPACMPFEACRMQSVAGALRPTQAAGGTGAVLC